MNHVLITGATSGIGHAFAEHFAREGYNLLLTGRRKRKLETIAAALVSNYGVKIDLLYADFTDPADCTAVLRAAANLDDIEVLINNAGFGHQSPFGDADYRQHDAMVQTHITMSIRLTHLVIAQMKRLQRGTIINVSSMLSLVPLPNSAIYCATKAFLTNFSETLAMELRPASIRVQSLLPGLTHTDFHRDPRRVGIPKRKTLYWMSPEAVVAQSVRALRRNRVVCIPGLPNRLMAFSIGLLPRRLVYAILSAVAARYL